MLTKIVLVAAVAAIAEARFGQEDATQATIQGLRSFGSPGQAATLAGQTPGVLLAGANACASTPFSATGLSVADVATVQGFTDFTAQANA